MSTVKDVVFLSWGGESSKSVASVLQNILRDHFPAADIFFSQTSIDVGEDPMKKMFDEGLLQAKVLVAVLTKESASRPWVVWETATAWAKDRLVVPIFVDVSPKEVPGPLTVKVQGIRIGDRNDVDRAMTKIGKVLGVDEDQSLTDKEWKQLTESVATSVRAEVPSKLPTLPAAFSQRTVPLNNGLHPGTLLAITVTAQNELDQAKVVMTSITGPPGAVMIPSPSRLFWHPSRQVSNTIAQDSSDLINVARVGPIPPIACMDSPDHDLPWSLENGAWRIDLQVTAKGYSAHLFTVAFLVRPADGLPNQTIEWTEFTNS